jgi:hypothetical protein
MIYICILVFLLSIYILNKRSKNNFFFQDEDVIRKKLDIILSLWTDFRFDNYDEIKLRLAFEYFIEHPSEYNGTSIINDMWLIKGLEPESVIHDYEDIMASNIKHLLKSNKAYCKRLRKRNAQFFWVWGFIFCGLTIVTLFKSIKFIKF